MAKKSKPANPWPEVLKALRDATGWSQATAAAEIGVSTRSWLAWESGEVVPSGTTNYALRCMVKTHNPSLLEKLS